MKRSAEELLKEISPFLVIYLKSGQVGLNSFIQKTDLHISQMDQLLKIHFLLKSEVKKFVRDLPSLIRRLKTSTTVKQRNYHGQVKGQINWQKTLSNPHRISTKDKTIFSVNERNREYAIKENLVLLEAIQTLHRILFNEVESGRFEKYDWFKDWSTLKNVINHLLNKNIYLSRVQTELVNVTDRMILDTLKHRNPLYRRAAAILQDYRRILSGEISQEEIEQLLRETFVYPEEEDVLFELYWVMKLIEQNTNHSQLQLMDGRNNLVAQWDDGKNMYKVYHDSVGTKEYITFRITTADMQEQEHFFIDRKLDAMQEAKELSNAFFNRSFDVSTYWSGRPDILVEIYDKENMDLKKVIIGEVKHTSRVEYAITGLRELVDYLKLVKNNNGRFLNNLVKTQGMLFTDRIAGYGEQHPNLRITDEHEEVVWCNL